MSTINSFYKFDVSGTFFDDNLTNNDLPWSESGNPGIYNPPGPGVPGPHQTYGWIDASGPPNYSPAVFAFAFDTNSNSGYFNKTFSPDLEFQTDFSYCSVAIWVRSNAPIHPTISKYFIFTSNDTSANCMSLLLQKTSGGPTDTYTYSLEVTDNLENGTTKTIGTYNWVNGPGGTVPSDLDWNLIVITIEPDYDNLPLKATIKTYFNYDETTNTYTDIDWHYLPNFGCIKAGIGRVNNMDYKYSGFISSFQISDTIYSDSTVNTIYNNNVYACFHENCMILTNNGEVKIIELKRGDLIKTPNGYKKLARLIKSFVNNKIKSYYVIFEKNSISENVPSRQTILTHGHPIYVNNEYQLAKEVYFSRKYENISMKHLPEIKYVYHLQFETHELVYANNLLATSLPHNTKHMDLYLPRKLYFDKSLYNENIIGLCREPYNLHGNLWTKEAKRIKKI